MKPKLIISGEDQETREITLEEGRDHIVGRDLHADISLAERRISRKHAILRWIVDTDTLELEDLGSLNGTYLNGQPVKANVNLKHGDQIRIGGFHILVDHPKNHISGFEFSAGLDLEPLKTHPDSSAPELSYAQDTFERLSKSEPLEETGGRLISGKLQELSLPDVLQMLATTRKSGVLVISDEKLLRLPRAEETKSVSKILIHQGDVIDAFHKEKSQEEAFYEILETQTGYFALFPLDSAQDLTSKIEMPLEMLLLEGMRKLDEKKAKADELQPDDILEPLLDEPLTRLSPTELDCFQLVWKYQRVGEVIEKATLSPVEVEESLKKLLRNGFLKKKA